MSNASMIRRVSVSILAIVSTSTLAVATEYSAALHPSNQGGAAVLQSLATHQIPPAPADRNVASLPAEITTAELSDWKVDEDIIVHRDDTTLASQSAVVGSLRTTDRNADGTPMRTLFAMLAIFSLLAGGMGCLQLAR